MQEQENDNANTLFVWGKHFNVSFRTNEDLLQNQQEVDKFIASAENALKTVNVNACDLARVNTIRLGQGYFLGIYAEKGKEPTPTITFFNASKALTHSKKAYSTSIPWELIKDYEK